MRYLYEYWDSNDWCKFINISIYKISEDLSAAASQTKNRIEVVRFGNLSLRGSFEDFSFCIFPPWLKYNKTGLNKEWPHIALTCYNESEKELSYEMINRR